jgi:hypothetical protein
LPNWGFEREASDAAIDGGRVRLVPASGGRPDRFAELEGAPDVVVEIVSDASVNQDTERLPACHRYPSDDKSHCRAATDSVRGC